MHTLCSKLTPQSPLEALLLQNNRVVCQSWVKYLPWAVRLFQNKSSSLWQRSLKSNPVDLPSKLHFMTQWRKRRHHSNHCRPDSYSTCSHFLFKGDAAWSHYEALKHHKRQVVIKNENVFFFLKETACDIYFVHMMYVWGCSALLSLNTQPLLL